MNTSIKSPAFVDSIAKDFAHHLVRQFGDRAKMIAQELASDGTQGRVCSVAVSCQFLCRELYTALVESTPQAISELVMLYVGWFNNVSQRAA